MRASANQRTGERGFTLIETLVALALMGLVLSALANLTAQWLPNWNRGLNRVQRSEMISIALQRLADDLAAAQSVPVSRDDKQLLFIGSEHSITFVRTSLGPNAGPGLDVVRLSETTDRDGLATVRSRMTFHPLPPQASLSDQLHFGEPVVLLRAPFHLSFAYAGDDRAWKTSWQDGEKLPAKVRLTVRDTSIAGAPSLSTVAIIHVQSSAKGDCKPQPNGQQANGQQPSAQLTNGQQASAQPQNGSCDDSGSMPANGQGGSQQGSPSATAQGTRS
jgi:general secretion pathway protein J